MKTKEDLRLMGAATTCLLEPNTSGKQIKIYDLCTYCDKCKELKVHFLGNDYVQSSILVGEGDGKCFLFAIELFVMTEDSFELVKMMEFNDLEYSEDNFKFYIEDLIAEYIIEMDNKYSTEEASMAASLVTMEMNLSQTMVLKTETGEGLLD